MVHALEMFMADLNEFDCLACIIQNPLSYSPAYAYESEHDDRCAAENIFS